MGVVKAGIKVACDRKNATSKNLVTEDIPPKMEKFYQSIADDKKAKPMLLVQWRFPDENGKVQEGEIVYPVLSPSSCETLLTPIERMQPPKAKTRAGKKEKKAPKPKPKPKAAAPAPAAEAKAEPKNAPAPTPKPVVEEEVNIDSDLFTD
jgi:hypothetical protein